MKKTTIASVCLLACFASNAELVRLVPEHGISKLFTMRTNTNREYKVSFFRPDVFRVQAALETEAKEGTNVVKRFDYADAHNDPAKAQILVDDYREDATRVDFEDVGGKFVFRTSEIMVSFDKTNETMTVSTWRGRKIFGESRPLLFTTNSCTQFIASDERESIWGGGQQLGRLMHKGRKIAIDCDFNWSDGGAPNPSPFFMSLRGYGVLRHTFASGEYDFTAADESRLLHEETRFDAIYFVGAMHTVIDRLTEATGRPNFMPIWSLELGDADAYMTRDKKTKDPQQDKDGKFVETTFDAVKVAQRYREEDMPGGWLLVNDGYGCGYTELAPVVAELAAYGFKTGLWTEGALDRIAWEVGTAGTRVQKLDVAWTCQGGAKYKNQFPLQCNKEAFDGLTKNADARGFCWTVLGWAGTQRYGICWAGDQYGGWDLIRYMIPGVTGSAMSGQAYATTDVDGIFGGSPETYLRDLQWKCWTTAMYVMNGWSDVNKSPWSYPEPYKSHIRAALLKKITLTPFLYTLMRNSFENGSPIVRPLVWNYPEDPICRDESTKFQFMVGADVLVAPVYLPEKITHGWWRKGIYLPSDNWYDYNDGRRIEGDEGLWIDAYPIDLGKIPVFVRGGAIIPMYKQALTIAEVDKKFLKFDIWPGSDGVDVASVYEDDGETRSYLKGEFTETVVSVQQEGRGMDDFDKIADMEISVMTDPTRSYKGCPEERVYLFDVHTQVKPVQVLVGSDSVAELKTTNDLAKLFANVRQGWYYDKDDKFGTVRIKLLPAKRGEDVDVRIRFASEVVVRDATPAYPVPTAEEAKELETAVETNAVHILRNKSIVSGLDMVVTNNFTILQRPETIYGKIRGHVATHPDNDKDARFTFRIIAGNHVVGKKQIFERANMKGNDVPQLIEVNLPADTQWVQYEFSADDDTPASKSAKGIWKNIRYIAE